MHIYKREFVESTGTELILPVGEVAQCWALGFPQEGEITRFIMKQSKGSSVEATVNLFDRQVCDLGSGSSTSLAEVDPMTRELAQIFPEQTLTSGGTLRLFEGEDKGPYTYRNREGTFAVPVRAIYLHVEVAANADGKQFEVAIEAKVGNETN